MGGAGPVAGRAVADRSEPFIVETPRGLIEIVRQQWRSQRAGSRWQWSGSRAEPGCGAGGKERWRARRSSKRRELRTV